MAYQIVINAVDLRIQFANFEGHVEVDQNAVTIFFGISGEEDIFRGDVAMDDVP